jgi:cytoskeletal protein CcmA (bactofilin family)
MVTTTVTLYLGVTLLTLTASLSREASRKKREGQALCLAEAGLEYTVWRLYEGDSGLPLSYSLADLGGSAISTVAQYLDSDGAPVAGTLEITSTGEYHGWQTEIRSIARYLPPDPTTEHNEIFNGASGAGHALFSGSDLTLSGTCSFDGNAHCNANFRLSGNVTVDGDVEAGGNFRMSGSNWIEGDVRYGGSLTESGSNHVGGERTQVDTALAMPVIDLAYYRSIAETIYEDGHTLAGHTLLPEGVIYVDGDLHLSGQTEGHGTLVVDGDVQISGDPVHGASAPVGLLGGARVDLRAQPERHRLLARVGDGGCLWRRDRGHHHRERDAAGPPSVHHRGTRDRAARRCGGRRPVPGRSRVVGEGPLGHLRAPEPRRLARTPGPHAIHLRPGGASAAWLGHAT